MDKLDIFAQNFGMTREELLEQGITNIDEIDFPEAGNNMRTPSPILAALEPPSEEALQEMNNFVQLISSWQDTGTKTLVEESRSSPALRDALMTERTRTGVRIGNWEINVKESHNSKGQIRKAYDVFHTSTQENIAIDLKLYESAHAIAKLLNSGNGINSAKIKKVLDLEEEFGKNYADAALFKKRIKQMNESLDFVKMDIYSARYEESRSKAIMAKEQLSKINERI